MLEWFESLTVLQQFKVIAEIAIAYLLLVALFKWIYAPWPGALECDDESYAIPTWESPAP